jgi:rhodanese-related sulfurtransferase
MVAAATAELRKRGISAERLEDGVIEWRAAGLPVQDRKAS